jgi:predicted esterase
VHVVASRWPELAERFAILGIQGEQWATWSELDDLRFNYTYVNWMGRSTYEGYPYTDRESPYLVTKAVEELDREYAFGRVFVGGHSQGGFLTYLLHMHAPESWAGTFPMAGGLVLQAEPDVFSDEKLLAAQRAVPMAIVHGTKDDVVDFATGRYVHERMLAHGFPALRLFAPESGHAFDFLPVGEVIDWLDALSTTDAATLARFAGERAKAGEWRDVAAALARAKTLQAGDALSAAAKALDEAASEDATTHLRAIQANADGAWVEPYLAWQDPFEHAPAAREAVQAYQRLQKEHDPKAKDAIAEARKAFDAGKRDAGWAKYREVVERWYAAKSYRTVKLWLANRK